MAPERWLAWDNISYALFGYMPWHFRGDPRVSATKVLLATHSLDNLGRLARFLKRLLASLWGRWVHGRGGEEGGRFEGAWWLGATEQAQAQKEDWAMSGDSQTWCAGATARAMGKRSQEKWQWITPIPMRLTDSAYPPPALCPPPQGVQRSGVAPAEAHRRRAPASS